MTDDDVVQIGVVAAMSGMTGVEIVWQMDLVVPLREPHASPDHTGVEEEGR